MSQSDDESQEIEIRNERAARAARVLTPIAITAGTGAITGGPIADWAGERVGLHFIPPGQPWRNGYIESFNSRVRDECLNINMFWSLAQARVVISDWKADYNHRRRHSALGYQAPAVYAAARTHQ